MPVIGPYSRPRTLAKMDQRTREAQILRATRRELTAHVGGRPSATQAALIERAAWLTLHVALLDAKRVQGAASEHDSRTYLAWSNSLTRTLAAMGLAAAPKPVATLADHLAERREAAARA